MRWFWNFENFVNCCVDFDNALLVKILILYYSYIIICISIITDFPFDIDESILSTELEAIPGMGIVGIKRHGDCARFHYTITYLTLPGDVEQIQASKIILKRTRLLVDYDLFEILIQCIYLLITISRLNLNFLNFIQNKYNSIKLIICLTCQSFRNVQKACTNCWGRWVILPVTCF